MRREPTSASKCLSGSHAYLVVGVVNHWGLPLALVVGIVDRWSFPGSTAGGGLTGRVRNLRSFPLTIHVLIPGGNTDPFYTDLI